MRDSIDLIAVLSMFLLSVPLTIAAAIIFHKLKPKAPPYPRRFFWTGAVVALVAMIIALPMVMPEANLGVLWCMIVVWLIACWLATIVQLRVLKFEPQLRKLVTIFIFTGLLVFPVFYTFILPEMEKEATAREAVLKEHDRKALMERAEKGMAIAQFNLGNLYAAGVEVPQDFTEAAKWYRKAAEQGDVEAQAALGRLYVNGTGVPQEDPEAYFWLSVATSGANEFNKGWVAHLRDRTELYMDSKDIQAVKKRVKEWKPSKPAKTGK